MTIHTPLEAVRARLEATGLDALVCYPGPNTVYLADYYGEPRDRHALLVVPSEGDPHFLAPEKTRYGIRQDARIDRIVVVVENDPAAIVKRFWTENEDMERVAVDGQAPFSLTDPLRGRAPDGATVEPANPILADLRRRKGREELERLRRSAAVADRISEEVRAMGGEAVGMTEVELAAEIRGRLHRAGGTRLSFDVVVAGGENGAHPPHRSSDRRIGAGEPVILDFGAFVEGYAGDQTRTVVFDGEPPEEFEAAYDTVRDALDAGVAAVGSGVTAGTVDRATREAITEHGFGEYICHATGHGVGCEAHESPTIEADNDRELAPGMVFSVEPGVYVEDEFGVRLEDLVVVTEEGCERLNDSPRTWRPL